MWRALFGNCRKSLDIKSKLALLQRAVMPCFDCRNTRWPAHTTLELEIDDLQRKMVGASSAPACNMVNHSRFSWLPSVALLPRSVASVDCGVYGVANGFCNGKIILNDYETATVGLPSCFAVVDSHSSFNKGPCVSGCVEISTREPSETIWFRLLLSSVLWGIRKQREVTRGSFPRLFSEHLLA